MHHTDIICLKQQDYESALVVNCSLVNSLFKFTIQQSGFWLRPTTMFPTHNTTAMIGISWLRGWHSGRTFAGEVSLSCCRPTADGWPLTCINVKNFHGSLTTVVRAQNDTSKTANITDTIFDRTYWYSRIQATAFWKSVRSDVLYLANYRCSVCNRECKPPSTPN